MKSLSIKLCLLLFGIFVSSAIVLAESPSSEKQKVLIVDSYNSETFKWTRQIYEGLSQALNIIDHSSDVYELHRRTLDAYNNDTDEKMAVVVSHVLAEIRRINPDIIICTDDDAFRLVGLITDPEVPVVFNGVNGDPSKYLSSPYINTLERPGHHITGVYQTTYFAQSLALAKLAYPDATRFSVISDTTTTGRSLYNALKTIDPEELTLGWFDTFFSNDIEDWKRKLIDWKGKVDVVFVFSSSGLSDARGEKLSYLEASRQLIGVSEIPEVGSWEFQVESGFLISATDSGVLQGLIAGYYAKKILAGMPAGQLPITTPKNGIPAVNIKRAEQLGLSLSSELVSIFVEGGKVFDKLPPLE